MVPKAWAQTPGKAKPAYRTLAAYQAAQTVGPSPWESRLKPGPKPLAKQSLLTKPGLLTKPPKLWAQPLAKQSLLYQSQA